ncbi:MAG TPA: DamX-like protein [Cycloclasticus sp.]|jgi:DamX protein|nr:DamX-like protein [Cycloclasticus sp.]
MSTNNEDKGGVFFTPERQQRLDLILHLMPNTRQVILLRGPEESGKSFFIRQFKEQVNSNYRVCSVSATELVKSNAPLQVCADTFDLLEGNEKQILVRFESWSKAGQKAIICVEDAHLLDKARFDFLFQLSESYECIHILLTSSENLGESVESLCQLIDIEPFTQRQTSEYARQRVNTKGLDFINLAGLDDVVLFIETGGLPGRINDVLDQLMRAPSSAGSQQDEKISKGLPRNWLIAIAGIVSIVLVYSFFSGVNEESPNKVIAKKISIAEPTVKELNETSEVAEQAVVQGLTVKPQEKIVKKRPIIEQKAEITMPVSVVKTIKSVEKIIPPVVLNEEPKRLPAVDLTLKEPAEKAPKLVVGIEKEEVAALKKETELTTLQKNHTWIKRVGPTRYTLQLLGVSNEKSASDYVLSHKGHSRLAYFQNKRNKGRWYSVIYGDFKDQPTAVNAAKKLPASLGKLKPWVRSFVAVRGDIYTK